MLETGWEGQEEGDFQFGFEGRTLPGYMLIEKGPQEGKTLLKS